MKQKSIRPSICFENELLFQGWMQDFHGQQSDDLVVLKDLNAAEQKNGNQTFPNTIKKLSEPN